MTTHHVRLCLGTPFTTMNDNSVHHSGMATVYIGTEVYSSNRPTEFEVSIGATIGEWGASKVVDQVVRVRL